MFADLEERDRESDGTFGRTVSEGNLNLAIRFHQYTCADS
jgi:hypothetical protein